MAAPQHRRHMEIAQRDPVLHMDQRADRMGHAAPFGRARIGNIGDEHQSGTRHGKVVGRRPAVVISDANIRRSEIDRIVDEVRTRIPGVVDQHRVPDGVKSPVMPRKMTA